MRSNAPPLFPQAIPAFPHVGVQTLCSSVPLNLLEELGKSSKNARREVVTVQIRPGDCVDSVIARIVSLVQDLPADSKVEPFWTEEQFPFKSHIIKVLRQDRLIAIVITRDLLGVDSSIYTEAKTISDIAIQIAGDAEIVRRLRDCIQESFNHAQMPFVTWAHSAGGGYMECENFYQSREVKVLGSCYPWLSQGPEAFYTEYLESSASLLLLIGPPGTGKTTFLLGLMQSKTLNALVSYDDVLLESDSLFTKFMHSPNLDLLVVEDADLMLASRESVGNKTMARLLSISDGLVQMPRKKIIFSTNLESTANIDPALLRPGRCFAVLHFRGLTRPEVSAVCQDYGLPDPGREATLASLFRSGDPAAQPGQQVRRTVGF